MIARFKMTNCKTCGVKCKTGKRNLCDLHYGQRIKSRSKEKPNKPIPKRSEKEKIRMAKYLKLRLEYLNEHPICEVKGCNSLATSIHHMAGRLSENLFNHFLGTCLSCHNHIEENPEWAKANGYSISRLNK